MATNKERTNATINKILLTVFRLMSQKKSWCGISVVDLEKEVGMTRGALFHNYKSKEDLFNAMVERYYFGRFSSESVPDEYRNTLRGFYSHFCEMLRDESLRMEQNEVMDWAFAMVNIEVNAFSEIPGFCERSLEKYMDEKAVWNMVICNAIRTGEIKKQNPLNLTNIFFNLYLGSIHSDALFNQKMDVDALKRQFDSIYALVVSPKDTTS